MQIHGAFYPPATYAGQAPAGSPSSHPVRDEAPPRQSRPIPALQEVKAAHDAYTQQRKRSASPRQEELSHPAKQAINTYVESDIAGGPELLHRVDVYA